MLTKSPPICGTTGTFQCSFWGKDHWHDIHGLFDGLCDVVRLPTNNGEIVLPSMMTCDIGMVMNADGAQRCSLSFSLKVLEEYPMYSSHSNLWHLYLYFTQLFCMILSLSLGDTRRLLMVLPPLKWTWIPILPQMILKLSLNPFV